MAESGLPSALIEAREELERLQSERDKLNVQIAKLEQVVAALKSVVEPQDDETAPIGLTNAVRAVLRAAIDKGPLSAPQIKEGLLAMGYDTGIYKQALATIHIVLKRLVIKTEVREFDDDSDAKRYWWAAYGDPPSTRSKGVRRGTAGYGQTGKRRGPG